MKFQTVAGSKSNTKFLDNSKYGLDVVTMHKDWFSMKLGWILSMLIPKWPQIIDLKTKTSLKDYVPLDLRFDTISYTLGDPIGDHLGVDVLVVVVCHVVPAIEVVVSHDSSFSQRTVKSCAMLSLCNALSGHLDSYKLGRRRLAARALIRLRREGPVVTFSVSR